MSLRALTIVLIRMFALWLLFQCFWAGEQFAIYAFTPQESSDSISRFIALTALFNLTVYLIVSFILLSRTHAVSALILPPSLDSPTDLVVTARDLAVVSFSLVGLIFLIRGLESLAYTMATLFFSPRDSFDQRIPISFDKAEMVVAIFKSILGFALFWGAGGMVKLVHWAREAGRSYEPEREV